jgi:hypothetical protein
MRSLWRSPPTLLPYLTRLATADFWLVLVALLGMIAAHATFWLVVQPVNRHWMAGEDERITAKAWLGGGSKLEGDTAWTVLRDRWEYGHVARAVMMTVSLLALVVSLVI